MDSLRLAEANKTGTPAADVSLLLADGLDCDPWLYHPTHAGNGTHFFDPECERCRELTLELSADIRLAEAIKAVRFAWWRADTEVIFLQSPISSPKRGFMLPTPMAP